MAAKRPILVTGSHRSGTSWVGDVLAAAGGVCYVHEPFSPVRRPGLPRVGCRRWYTCVTRANEHAYLEPARRIVRLDYDPVRAARTVRGPRGAVAAVRQWARFAAARAAGARALLKDPFAFFSAEWLASRFGARVVVTVRHPAAFAWSLKRLGWTSPVHHLLGQPVLVREYLGPFEEEMRDHAAAPRGEVERAALLWKVVYATAARLRGRHADWVFVRHEDLAREPENGFRDLAGRLRLAFEGPVARRLARWKSPGGPPAPEDPYSLERDGGAAASAWKRALGPEDIERVRSVTGDAASLFYSDAEWE